MNPNLITTEIEQNASIITEVTQLPAVNTVVEESKTLQTVVDEDKTPIQTVVEENTSNIVSLINQPTVQVTSVNGKTGDVEVEVEVSEFKPGKYYKRGTLTTHNGSVYIAKNDITPTSFNLAEWEGVSGGYNDQLIIDRITALEQKPDKDTIYDDAALKTRVSAVETGKADVGVSYTKAESDNNYAPKTHTHAYSALTGQPQTMSSAESNAGTANLGRLIQASVLKGAVQTHQIQPDWNATSGKGAIQNKPTLLKIEDVFHIGQILITTALTTPEAVSAKYGGTWVMWGQGRTIIGVGSNGENNYTGAEQTGGWDNVALTADQVPEFSFGLAMHGDGAATVLSNVWANNSQTRLNRINYGQYRSGGGDISGAASVGRFNVAIGRDQPHENRQKYITAYFWKKVL